MNNLLNNNMYELSSDLNQFESSFDSFSTPLLKMARSCSSVTDSELRTPDLMLDSESFEYSSMDTSSFFSADQSMDTRGNYTEHNTNETTDADLSYNDEIGQTKSKKAENGKSGNSTSRKRIKFSSFQLNTLEQSFMQNSMPTTLVRRQLAKKLNLTSRCVQVWFQNRRAKSRSSQKRNNMEYINSLLSSNSYQSDQSCASYYQVPQKSKIPTDACDYIPMNSSNSSDMFSYPGFYSIPAIPDHQSMYSAKLQANSMVNNLFSQPMAYPKFTPEVYHDQNNCLNSYNPPSSSSSSSMHLPVAHKMTNLDSNSLAHSFNNTQSTPFYDINMVRY